MKRINQFMQACLLFAFMGVVSGCANVQPWERGNLAKAANGFGSVSFTKQLKGA